MTSRRPRHTVARALGLTALGTALVVAACEAPHPTGPRPQRDVPLASLANAAPEMAPAAGGVTAEQIRAALADRLEAMTRSHARQAVVIVDTGGTVRQRTFGTFHAQGQPGGGMRMLPPTEEPVGKAISSLDASTIKSIEIMKFAPGRLTADSVGVIWVTVKSWAPGATSNVTARDTSTSIVRMGAQSTPSERTFRLDTGEAPKATQPPQPSERPATVRIRGTTQLGSDPILLVDGQIVQAAPRIIIDGAVADSGLTIHQALARIPTDSIDTVEVLKGQAAVDAYGERARNGVILVTTKRPKTRPY